MKPVVMEEIEGFIRKVMDKSSNEEDAMKENKFPDMIAKPGAPAAFLRIIDAWCGQQSSPPSKGHGSPPIDPWKPLSLLNRWIVKERIIPVKVRNL
jgi:hypothetical protein